MNLSFIWNFFKPSAAGLNKQTTKAMGVFSKARTKLEKVLADHERHHATVTKKIGDLQAEQQAVVESKGETLKFIDSINTILK